MRIPVPVADSQFRTYTAPSGAAFGTTGGILWTIWCSPAIGTLTTELPSRKVFTCGSPQRKTSTLRMANGTQARTISPEVWVRGAETTVVAPLPPAMAATDTTRLACQCFGKVITATIETIAAMTSTSQGPWKLETRNCGTAKNKPAT